MLYTLLKFGFLKMFVSVSLVKPQRVIIVSLVDVFEDFEKTQKCYVRKLISFRFRFCNFHMVDH